jgi:hypothetical protein
MSAIKSKQRTAKEAGLLGQLRVSGEYADQDAAVTARQMFGCEIEAITEDQGWAMLRAFGAVIDAKREAARAARTPISGPHSHPCFQCGGSVNCYRDECRETVSEHRWCHEAGSYSEWVTYHRRLERQGY